MDKPKAEVQSCVQCHSVATQCDSCHRRHRVDPAEARRPEACITCDAGPRHPDDETFFASTHGRLYREEGADWEKPLSRGAYRAPGCAYCHLRESDHGGGEQTRLPAMPYALRSLDRRVGIRSYAGYDAAKCPGHPAPALPP